MSDDHPIPIPAPTTESPESETTENAEVRLEDLELSIRSSTVLLQLDIETLQELSRMTEAELLKTKNCGRKVLKELVEHLEEHSLRFGMTD